MINIRLIVYSDTEPEYTEVGWLHKINDVLVLSFYDNGEWKYTSSGITEDLINTEILNRIDADAVLNNRVDTEATTRNSADNTLSNALNSESSSRANADTLLNSDIVAEKNRATLVENAIGTSVGLDHDTKIYTNTGLYIGKLVVNTVASDIKALDTLTKSNTDNIATLLTGVIEAKTEVKGQTDKVDVVSSTGTDGHIIYTVLLDPNFLAIVNNKVDKVTGSSLLSDTEILRLSTMLIVLTLDGTSTTSGVSQNALKLFKDGIPAQTNAIIDGQLNTGGTIDTAILNKASLFNTGLLGSLTVASADPTPGKNGYYVYTDSGTNTHGTIDAGDTLLVTYDNSVYTYTLIKKYNNINIEYAKNNTGSTIGRGKLIYISGSTGENLLFLLATNTDYNIAARTWGMTYDGINANAVGRVIHFGLIENLDTSAYTAGTELWLGVNGEYTNVRPTSPAFQTSIGMVIRQSATVGSIFINMRYVNIENVRSQNTNTSPSSKLFDDLNIDYVNTQKLIDNHIFIANHSILLNNGLVSYNSGYSVDLVVSDYIPISRVYGYTIGKLEAWKLAQANPIAFYDINKNTIGVAYNPASIDTETSVTITINDTLLAQYPNAYYVRFGGNKSLDFTVRTINGEKLLNNSKQDILSTINGLLDFYNKKNILCTTMLNVDNKEFYKYENWDNQRSVFLAKDTGILTSGIGSEGYFYVTPFILVKNIKKIHFTGKTFNNVSFYVFYDINENIISQQNGNNETEADIIIPDNVYYIRLCGDIRIGLTITVVDSIYNEAVNKLFNSVYEELLNYKNYIANGNKFINSLFFTNKSQILKNDGTIYYDSSFTKYSVTDFIPISMLYGCTIGLLEAWRTAQCNPIAFYDINKNVINTAYNPATVDTETSVTITINDTLLAQYPNAYYCKLGGNNTLDLVFKNINNEKRLELYKNELYSIFKDKNILCNTFLNVEGTEFTTNIGWDNQKSVFLAKDTGVLTSGAGTEGYFCVSPFIPIKGISKVHFSGYIYDNTALCVQYDINKSIISVINATNNTETDVDIDNNAYYIRFCGVCHDGYGIPIIKLIDTTCENYQNKLNLDFYDNIIKGDNFYKMNNFDNAIFCGDSVTKGYVVEGTDTTQYIYQEIPEKSYPMQFAKMFPKINVTIKAQTGISAIDYLSNIYPTIDYSQYDLAVVELGLNGYLNYDDLNVEGTNTNCYRKIIQGIRQQNKNAIIVLNRSSHFSTYWMPILQYIATESNCIVLDLTSRRYLNLDDAKYHGYYQDGSKRSIDWAHFTRKGYNAKAFVFSKLLEEQLIDSTLYN